MKRISLALFAGVLPALSAAPHAATLGVSMALFDDNFLTAVRASMKERAQQPQPSTAMPTIRASVQGLVRNS
jgi:ABC-type sugar transport system substrate-binding protein